MKKFIKKTACALILSFSTVFVFEPYSFASHLSSGRFVTERWGRGGRWETKDNSASNVMWPIVFGVLGVGVLIWLFKKGPSFNEQKVIYIEKKPTSPKKEKGEQGAPLEYNSAEEYIEEDDKQGIIAIDSNESYEKQEAPAPHNDGHTNEVF